MEKSNSLVLLKVGMEADKIYALLYILYGVQKSLENIDEKSRIDDILFSVDTMKKT